VVPPTSTASSPCIDSALVTLASPLGRLERGRPPGAGRQAAPADGRSPPRPGGQREPGAVRGRPLRAAPELQHTLRAAAGRDRQRPGARSRRGRRGPTTRRSAAGRRQLSGRPGHGPDRDDLEAGGGRPSGTPSSATSRAGVRPSSARPGSLRDRVTGRPGAERSSGSRGANGTTVCRGHSAVVPEHAGRLRRRGGDGQRRRQRRSGGRGGRRRRRTGDLYCEASDCPACRRRSPRSVHSRGGPGGPGGGEAVAAAVLGRHGGLGASCYSGGKHSSCWAAPWARAARMARRWMLGGCPGHRRRSHCCWHHRRRPRRPCGLGDRTQPAGNERDAQGQPTEASPFRSSRSHARCRPAAHRSAPRALGRAVPEHVHPPPGPCTLLEAQRQVRASPCRAQVSE